MLLNVAEKSTQNNNLVLSACELGQQLACKSIQCTWISGLNSRTKHSGWYQQWWCLDQVSWVQKSHFKEKLMILRYWPLQTNSCSLTYWSNYPDLDLSEEFFVLGTICYIINYLCGVLSRKPNDYSLVSRYPLNPWLYFFFFLCVGFVFSLVVCNKVLCNSIADLQALRS